MPSYTKPERFSLKADAATSERWVQELIAHDPSILGLGDLALKDRERSQPRAGRLDLLLQGNFDDGKPRRYEVEIQLGSTDEAHIVRTIEYWDIERKRYPQYDHCAVIVAEDITSRFLNVISMFNGAVPLIAIQMQGYRVGGLTTLIFTTVVDELTRGLVDEDEEGGAAPVVDRAYWSQKAPQTIELADKILAMVQQAAPSAALNMTRQYIGILIDGVVNNFVWMTPKKKFMNLSLKLEKSAEADQLIEASKLEMSREPSAGVYRVRIFRDDLAETIEPLERLLSMAYEASR